MDSRLTRARRFLLGRSKSTALRVAPLALLAIGALQAATVTVTGPTFGVGGGSLFPTVINTAGGDGVKFSGFGSSDFYGLTSTSAIQFDFIVANDSASTTQLDFVFDLTSLAGDIAWSVSDGGSTLYDSGIAAEKGGVPDTVTGSALVNNGTVRFLFVSQFFGDGFSLDVPANSIDFTPPGGAAVPEPGTMVLTLASGAMLALARRRRQ